MVILIHVKTEEHIQKTGRVCYFGETADDLYLDFLSEVINADFRWEEAFYQD